MRIRYPPKQKKNKNKDTGLQQGCQISKHVRKSNPLETAMSRIPKRGHKQNHTLKQVKGQRDIPTNASILLQTKAANNWINSMLPQNSTSLFLQNLVPNHQKEQ